MRTRVLSTGLAVAVIGAGILVAGCGDDDDGDDGESGAAAGVSVAATEYAFDFSATPTTETTELTLTNEGSEPHALIFARINEGFTLDEAFELQGREGSADDILQLHARPGQSQTKTIDEPLEPGSYAMVCPIPAGEGETHFSLGQRAEFTIE